jgi:hypothetical protein
LPCPTSPASPRLASPRACRQGRTKTNTTLRARLCIVMDNLTPQDLFSPSKARQQRAQAADWAQIDSWLSYKYAGRTVPTFERNEETLKVLRELSLANERADEERMIMHKVEREACKELEADEV